MSYLEQFQQKCAAVLLELRESKEIEHFRDSKKNGNALALLMTDLAAPLPAGCGVRAAGRRS